MKACWTSGWKGLEVTGAIEEALEEKKSGWDDGGRDQRPPRDNCDERGMSPVGQKTQWRGGMGDQKPCTSIKTLDEKKHTKEKG